MREPIGQEPLEEDFLGQVLSLTLTRLEVYWHFFESSFARLLLDNKPHVSASEPGNPEIFSLKSFLESPRLTINSK